MTTAPKVTRAQAEATLAAVKAQYAAHLTERTYDGETYPPLYPDPVLIEDYDGPGWAIVWEEGPDEWVFTIHGGSSEEERVLTAAAAAEFGAPYVEPVRKPAKMPTTVFVEPINHIVLGVYPA